MSAGPPFRGRSGAWSVADIPPQAGQRALVTGGTGGLGLEVAAALAAAGAEVVIAGRSAERGAAAAAEIGRRSPHAAVAFRHLDLADPNSIRRLAATAGTGRLDLLVNNAGLRANASDGSGGVERHFAVNHLGHFALTAALWPQLRAAPAARVVTVASNAHWDGALGPDGLPAARAPRPRQAYADSKLANLVFALELARRLAASGSPAASLAAHPGTARTGLFAGDGPPRSRLRRWAADCVLAVIAQSAADGALPILFAATSPEARNGAYVGPASWAELRGAPAPAMVSPAAADPALGAALWAASERLIGRAWRVAGDAQPGAGDRRA